MSANRNGWRIALWAAIAVAVLSFIYAVRSILPPFILAFLISAILSPALNWMVKKGFRKGFASFILIFSFFGLILVGLIVLTPKVTEQVTGLKDKGEYLISAVAKPNPMDNFFYRGNPENRVKMANAKDPLDTTLAKYSDLLTKANLPTTKRAIVAQYIEPQRDQISNTLQNGIKASIGVASGMLSQVFTLIFVPLLVMLILPNADEFKSKVLSLMPPQIQKPTSELADDIGEVLGNYFRGVAIAVFGYMAAMAILLSVLGVPYALLLGVLFGAVYLIPYLNAVISGVTLVLVIGLSGKTQWFGITFSSSWTYAFAILAIFVVCNFLYDSIVYPRFVGNAVGLHPLASMLVIFSGGALFGLPGMILAFPVAGCVKVILDRLLTITNKVEKELVLPEIPLRHRETS